MHLHKTIYKIATCEQWETALRDQNFKGAPIDLQDGYIHFSTASQAQETLDKHFKGQTDLLLLVVETVHFGEELKWEPSRGGDLFPHLYSTLDVNLVSAVHEIKTHENGTHDIRGLLDAPA